MTSLGLGVVFVSVEEKSAWETWRLRHETQLPSEILLIRSIDDDSWGEGKKLLKCQVLPFKSTS